MNGGHLRANERMLELLADRATEGLDVVAGDELNGLLTMYPDYDDHHFESAAAAIDLAMMPRQMEPLPNRLRERVLAEAALFNASRDQIKLAGPTVVHRRSQPTGRIAYYLVAASLAFACFGWWQGYSNRASTMVPIPQQFAAFLGETEDVVTASWVGQEGAFESVSGECVWSETKQTGFMRFVGLPVNDPRHAQYQLWIVDPKRDKNPVDGGVFDVGSDGEVIVPIDAKLAVDHPKVFAITLEKPGGVVVSAGPLLVVGSLAG